jgi:hypothetical protein
MTTRSALTTASRSPDCTRFQGTPQPSSSRTALGAVCTNMRATCWSHPQSLPRTVSSKCTSSLSPAPMALLARLACMPPWAAAECERLGGTRLSTSGSSPRRLTPMAVRNPASPPPTTSTSE